MAVIISEEQTTVLPLGRQRLSGVKSPRSASGHRIVVVMGVAGAGKSSVGRVLAERMGCTFLEGDDFHSSESMAKMRSGIALSDEDRAPWLSQIADWITNRREEGECGVVSCSALRRRYRDQLRAAGAGFVQFVFLQASAALLRDRLQARTGHFMAAAMVDSQLSTLEPPDGEAAVLVLDADKCIDALCERALAWSGS